GQQSGREEAQSGGVHSASTPSHGNSHVLGALPPMPSVSTFLGRGVDYPDKLVSPHAGDKRKRPKKVADDDDDDDDDETKFVGSTAATPGQSANEVPESVANLLDRHLCEITALLRDLVSKLDNLTNRRGKAREADEAADEDQVDYADEQNAMDGNADAELTGSRLHSANVGYDQSSSDIYQRKAVRMPGHEQH
ncbi:hypothetical protein EV401DRAFT_1892179, partial [Pisolithus croceorrhizus]